MTDKRISPLQWLSTKFASLNHSHSEYLTQHQSLKTINNETITGTGNITIDSGSDIDIVTDWEQTLSDEKVASEKLVKESIDSVLYKTEELELGTPTTSSNVNFTIIDGEDTETITIPTLNSCQFNHPSLNGFVEYEFDLTFPTNENAIFVFGEESGFTLFRTSGASSGFMTFGDCDWRKNIYYDDYCYFRSYSSIKINVQMGINSAKIYLNDRDNTYREIYTSDDVMFSSNVTINSITAKLWNVPKQLSRYVDDINKLKELPLDADLNSLNEDIIYVGYNNNNAMSHCPVSDKQFILINKDIPYESYYRSHFQQILIVLNGGYGSYEEVWVRYQEPSTGGFDGSWTKLATTSDLNSKQDTLVSGTNLKTINNESILGSGNISISGGSGTVDSSWVANSTNPVESQLIKSALDNKSDTSHTHSQYLTEHQSLANYVQKSSTTGLVKNDGTIDTTSYSTFDGNYNNLTNKPTIPTMTSQLTNNSGFASDCTELMSTNFYDNAIFSWDSEDSKMELVGGISFDLSQTWYNGGELATLTDLNDYVDESEFYSSLSNYVTTSDSRLSDARTPLSHTHTTTDITNLSIPTASSTTPSADTTSGSVGNGTTWARSNHTHPKSSLYAEAEHTHSSYVNPTIADNLTTNDSSQVLSAKQGKILNDMIGQAISYINQ